MRARTKKQAVPSVAQAEAAFKASAGLVPGVLTVDAVAKGYMPPFGKSGLPSSLEKSIPPEYRYWLAKDASSARDTRDALVEKSLITEDSLLMVEGELRRVLKRIFLAEEDDGQVELARPEPAAQQAALSLAYSGEPVVVYEADVAPRLEDIAKQAEGEQWIAAYEDTEVSQAALLAGSLASVFKLKTRPGVIFASNVELAEEAEHVEVVKPPVEKSLQVRVGMRKAASDAVMEEERFIYGVVLEPETEDSQGDIYSAEEIRKTAHGFMEGYRAGNYLATQHDGDDITGDLLVLESFVAPVDFELEGAGGVVEKVKKGTWLLGERVVSDELWTQVKKGLFTGYSMGGTAIRKPDPRVAEEE